MRLFGAELHRFRARRVVLWLFVLALAVVVIAMTITAVHSKVHPVSSPSLECKVLPAPTDANGNPGQPVERCTPFGGPLTRDDRVHYDTDLGDAIGGSGVALLLFAVLLGATFIGADYGANALAGQLTFEPRRVRVYVTKALAVFFAVGLVVLVLLLVICGALAGVTAARGVFGTLDGSWWLHRAGDAGRVALTAGVAAALAFAVTSVARRTVAAVVGFLAFAFIVEPALTASLDLFDGRTPVIALVSCALNDFKGAPEGVTSLGASALVAGVWTAVLLVAGGMIFSRREMR